MRRSEILTMTMDVVSAAAELEQTLTPPLGDDEVDVVDLHELSVVRRPLSVVCGRAGTRLKRDLEG